MMLGSRRFPSGLMGTAGVLGLASLVEVARRPRTRAVQQAAVGADPPDFTLEDCSGRVYCMSSFRGRKVLVCFFCGCARCRAMAPEWERVHEAFPGTAVLGITTAGPAAVDRLARSTGIGFPVLSDPACRVASLYQSIDCPRCWIVAENGRIEYASSPGDDPSAVAGHLRRLLAPPGSSWSRRA